MAATKFGFITQPISTNQGYTIQGGWTTDYTMLGVSIPQTSSSLIASPGILIGCLNADGTLDTTSTTAVTIAIGTNPTSGSTLSGTLTRNAVAGIAAFNDLAITLGGAGYTLTATGSLTTATSNAFTLATVKRVNPAMLSGTLVGSGIANALGPYRFRPGRSVAGVSVSAVSTNTTDTVTVAVTEPGAATSANTTGAIYNPSLGSAAVITATVPFTLALDDYLINGPCDIYVYAGTNTGTIVANIKRTERTGGQ
jgi:hypothetical protein